MKVLVIGGGFFGMYIAEYIAKKNIKVLLCEKESCFMQRASLNNQARVHRGYHYPRSILTALRSKVSFKRFINEFKDSIDDSFEKYYMISKILSKVSTHQFLTFCKRVGIECLPASKKITKLINPCYIDKVFSVQEYGFDATIIKETMLKRLQNVNVEYYLKQEIQSIKKYKGKFVVISNSKHKSWEISNIDIIFNCTYSKINKLIDHLKFELIPLKHEICEIVLLKVPKELEKVGITIVDGPFFSIMPFPSKKVHSFSHVRYTPHYEWHDRQKEDYKEPSYKKNSAYPYMIRDAMRYIPILSESHYIDSMWEIKTVLPWSENCDSRPIFFGPNHGLEGFHNVVGGKIDNIYDIVDIIGSTGILNGK